MRRWSKKAKVPDIFALQKMVVPVNIRNMHWTSVHVDFLQREIVFYDSMGGAGEHYMEATLGYLKAEHEKKKGTPLPKADEWKENPEKEAEKPPEKEAEKPPGNV